MEPSKQSAMRHLILPQRFRVLRLVGFQQSPNNSEWQNVVLSTIFDIFAKSIHMNTAIEYGKFYHIFNRGNNKEKLFRSEGDFLRFLQLYKIYTAPIADTYAWCLMSNHFHFCVRIKEKHEIGYLNSKNAHKNKELKWAVQSTSQAETYKQPKPVSQLKFMFNAYSKYFNNKYARTGSLFEKNFERKNIEDESYLTSLIIYINNNPVKHLYKNNPGEYLWSSYNETLDKSSTLCDLEFLWNMFEDAENFKYVHDKRIDEDAGWDDYFE